MFEGKLSVTVDFLNGQVDHVTYSQTINQEDASLIKQKVTGIAKQIYAAMSEDSAPKQMDFIFDGEREFQIVVERAEGKENYNLNQLGGEALMRSQELVRVVHNLGRSILASSKTEEAASSLLSLSQPLKSTHQEGRLSKLLRSIQRWFGSSFTLNPQIEKFVKSYFNVRSQPKDLKNMWEWEKKSWDVDQVVDQLHEKLNEGSTNGSELFSREEIAQKVSSRLEEAFFQMYQAATGKFLTDADKQTFRNEKKIYEMSLGFQGLDPKQAHRSKDVIREEISFGEKKIAELTAFLNWQELLRLEWEGQGKSFSTDLQEKMEEHVLEREEVQAIVEGSRAELKAVEDFESSQLMAMREAESAWSKVIDEIPAIDFPFERLADLPINAYTENSLMRTWKRLLEELAKEGELHRIGLTSDPAVVAKQTAYGDTYLLALQLLPKKFSHLSQEVFLDSKQIEPFIYSQPHAFKLKSAPQEVRRQRQQRLYQSYIRPFIDKKMDQILNQNTDFLSIAAEMTNPRSKILRSLVEKMEKKLEAVSLSKTEREELGFTSDTLLNHLLAELELLGMQKYHLSGDQIARLREARQVAMDRDQRMEHMQAKLSVFKERESAFAEQMKGVNGPLADEQKSELVVAFVNFAKEQIKEWSVVDLPIEFLWEIPITEDNQFVMGEIASFLLAELHAISTSATKSEDRKQASLQYRLARNVLAEIESPADFKRALAKQMEEWEKPAAPTQALMRTLQELEHSPMEERQQSLVEALQELEGSQMRFESLASLAIAPANADAIVAMWKSLLQKSLKQMGPSLKSETAPSFDTLSERDLRNLEEGMHQYLAILAALRSISNPLVQEKLQALIEEGEKEFSQDRQQDILVAVKNSLYDEKFGVGIFGAGIIESLMVGEVDSTSAPSSQLNQASQLLSAYEIQGLQVLSKALASAKRQSIKLSQEEFNLLQSFITYARQPSPASQALKAKLQEIIQGKRMGAKEEIKEIFFDVEAKDDRFFKKIPHGISLEAALFSIDLSQQLRESSEFAALTNKLENILAKVGTGETIKPEEQLRRRELGILAKCAQLGRETKKGKGLLEKLQELGLLERDPLLLELAHTSEKAQGLLNALEETFQSQIGYRDGDFVANLGRQMYAFYGHKISPEQHLHLKLITPYVHGAKIYLENGKRKISHVLGGYEQSDYTFMEESYSEVWRLDVAALMPKEKLAALRSLYGQEWNKVIQTKYEEIENRIHKNEKQQFNQLENSWERRIDAGKADYIWGGHVRKTERDFNKLANRILGDGKTKRDHLTTMICSEFVTKTTIAALVLLNRELSKEMGDHLIEQGQMEEGERLKREQNVFELPYSKREKLKNVHPGRMIDLLKNKNCLKRLDTPRIIQQVVRSDA